MDINKTITYLGKTYDINSLSGLCQLMTVNGKIVAVEAPKDYYNIEQFSAAAVRAIKMYEKEIADKEAFNKWDGIILDQTTSI